MATEEQLATFFLDGVKAKLAGDYAKAARIFTEYLSMVSDNESIRTAYGERGEVFMEAGQREAAIADMKKAIDLGADVYEDMLQEEYGITYKPQKPSFSGGSPLGAFPLGSSPSPASSNVWKLKFSKSVVSVDEVYKKEGVRVKKGDKLLKADGKVYKSEVEGTIINIPDFSCTMSKQKGDTSDIVLVEINIGK